MIVATAQQKSTEIKHNLLIFHVVENDQFVYKN